MNLTYSYNVFYRYIWDHSNKLLPTIACLAIGLASPGFSQNDEASLEKKENADAIISKKDNVALVDDSSVKEAIKRRPELAFTKIRIDGEASAVSLDNIHSDSIESVEVMKAVTPDLDADSIGGFVSLRSKPAYENEAVTTKGSLAINYSDVFGDIGFDTSISQGGPLNKAGTFGGQFSARSSRSNSGSNDLFQDWGPIRIGEDELRVLQDSRLIASKEKSDESSVNAAFDYKVGESLSLFWRSKYVRINSKLDLDRLQYRFDQGSYSEGSESHAKSRDARVMRTFDLQNKELETFESGVGGLFEKDSIELDFKLTYQQDGGNDPTQFAGDFSLDHVDLEYTLENRALPDFRALNGKDIHDARAFRFDELRVKTWDNEKTDLIAAANLRVKNIFQNEKNYLKFGAKHRERDEEQTIGARIFQGNETDFANFRLSDALSERRFDQFLYGKYNLDTLVDPELAKQYFLSNEPDFNINQRRSRETADPNTYQAEEEVTAYYGMMNWENDRWRWILGYRIEDATVTYNGSEVIIDDNGQYLRSDPAIGVAKFSNAFPNAHFRYLWNNRVTVIGSYTETIQRPWYADIVPSRSIDFQQTTISEGNPSLQPTLLSNWDLSFDINYLDTSMLSIELFKQSIDDTIFLNRTLIPTGEFAGFERERKENSASADLQGARFTLDQPLDVFGMPKGLSARATYTLQESEIEYPNRIGEILPLPWTSESFIDATIDYSTEKWFIQLRYMHNEPMLARVGDNLDEDKYQIEQERFGLDISWKYRKKSRLFIEIENLTSTPNFENIEGNKFFPLDIRQTSWNLRSGLKFEL